MKKVTIGLIGLLLTCTQAVERAHASSMFSFENVFQSRFAPQTTIRQGLFKNRDIAPVGEKVFEVNPSLPPPTIPSASEVLWKRMRNEFELKYPPNHPSIQKFIRQYSRSNEYLNLLSRNAEPFLYDIVLEITRRGLPMELALLPMVESSFEPHATSPKGADGMWQIMPATGKMLGLRKDHWYEGRRDSHASTRAALNHLHYLNRTFNGDWLLALAAYNAGEKRVQRAIEQNKRAKKATDFWNLPLPKETKEYVPKFLATVALVKAPEQYGRYLPNIADRKHVDWIDVPHQMDIKQVAAMGNIQVSELLRLNPSLTQKKTPPAGPHRILVPASKVQAFSSFPRTSGPNVVQESKTYQVQEGDTLLKLASQFNTSVSALKNANGITDNNLPQKDLIIPETKAKSIHMVTKGETLWQISEHYKVDAADLIAWNQITTGKIQVGQELLVEPS